MASDKVVHQLFKPLAIGAHAEPIKELGYKRLRQNLNWLEIWFKKLPHRSALEFRNVNEEKVPSKPI
jgi:hypothetical protein